MGNSAPDLLGERGRVREEQGDAARVPGGAAGGQSAPCVPVHGAPERRSAPAAERALLVERAVPNNLLDRVRDACLACLGRFIWRARRRDGCVWVRARVRCRD